MESQPGGGGEKHTLEVAEFLRDQGHNVYFAGSCRHLNKMAAEASFPVEKINFAGTEAVSEMSILKFFFTWPSVKKHYQNFLSKQKRQRNIDTLYLLSWNEKFLLTPIAKKLRMKVFFVEHRLLERYIRLNPFRGWYGHGTKYAKVFAVSEAVKKTALEVGVPAGQIQVIANGVDATVLDKYYSQGKVERGLIGAAGRMSSEKGLDILLRAFALIQQRNPQSRLAIAGDGPAKEELEHLSQKLGISEKVDFLGLLPFPEEYINFLSKLEVFALPSRSESFGLALAEAGYLGIPCVATNIGGIKEVVVAGKTGLLVPPDNHEALAKTLAKLLADKELCQRLGGAARRHVKNNFSKKRMLSRIEKFLQT